MNKNIMLYPKEYYEYVELLSDGHVYYILICHRLLLRPIIPVWLYLLGLFLVQNYVFFAVITLPSIVIFLFFLIMLFPIWAACNVSIKAYIAFHSACIILLKIVSIPVSALLEVLWTLCF